MSKMQRLQRGAADLIAVAVGMTLLSIAAIGTSTALVYGREALVQQEHFKVAAFQLRGELEKEVARIQLDIAGYVTRGQYTNFQPIEMFLDNPQDRNGEVYQTVGEIDRMKADGSSGLDLVDVPSTPVHPDYVIVTMRATWGEAVVAGVQDGSSRFDRVGPQQTIVLSAPVLQRGSL